MLLFIHGEWHRPILNEPLIPSGWEKAFRLAAGKHPPENMHCSMILTYKAIDPDSFFTDEMVEAASQFNMSKAVKLAMEMFLSAPDKILELDFLPQQVAASAVLSQHELVKVHVKGETAEFSKPTRFAPLEILKTVYARPFKGCYELRSTISPEAWRMFEAVSTLQAISPDDGLAILSGKTQKIIEVVNLLKVEGRSSRNSVAGLMGE